MVLKISEKEKEYLVRSPSHDMLHALCPLVAHRWRAGRATDPHKDFTRWTLLSSIYYAQNLLAVAFVSRSAPCAWNVCGNARLTCASVFIGAHTAICSSPSRPTILESSSSDRLGDTRISSRVMRSHARAPGSTTAILVTVTLSCLSSCLEKLSLMTSRTRLRIRGITNSSLPCLRVERRGRKRQGA